MTDPKRPFTKGRKPDPSEELEDIALRFAANDRRNGLAIRLLAWFAWAYNRSAMHDVIQLVGLLSLEAPGSGGPLISLWRRLAYRMLPPDRIVDYLNDAVGAPRPYSGLVGLLLVPLVWAIVLVLAYHLIVAVIPEARF